MTGVGLAHGGGNMRVRTKAAPLFVLAAGVTEHEPAAFLCLLSLSQRRTPECFTPCFKVRARLDESRSVSDNYNSRPDAVHLYQGRYIRGMLGVFGSGSVRISRLPGSSRERKKLASLLAALKKVLSHSRARQPTRGYAGSLGSRNGPLSSWADSSSGLSKAMRVQPRTVCADTVNQLHG